LSYELVDKLRDRAFSSKVPDPLLEEAADELERLTEAMGAVGEGDDEVAWREGENVEFLSSREWIIKASAELDRLRLLVADYVAICKASEREIAELRGKP